MARRYEDHRGTRAVLPRCCGRRHRVTALRGVTHGYRKALKQLLHICIREAKGPTGDDAAAGQRCVDYRSRDDVTANEHCYSAPGGPPRRFFELGGVGLSNLESKRRESKPIFGGEDTIHLDGQRRAKKDAHPPLEFKLDALRGLLCGFKAEGDLIVVDGFRPGIGGGAGGDDEEWEAEEVKGAIHHCELECRGRG